MTAQLAIRVDRMDKPERAPTPDEIRAWRAASGLSQRECADRCGGVTERTWRNWETGVHAPNNRDAIRKLNALLATDPTKYR